MRRGIGTSQSYTDLTDALAPGATLLALYVDGRNAIATKGQVVSVTASVQDSAGFGPFSAAAQLAVNAGNVLGPRLLTVVRKGKGTVTGTRINCGSACSAQFGASQTPTLTAKAKKKKGFSFKGWSGGGCKGKSTCKPDISGGSTTVTATFVKKCKKKKKQQRSAEIAKKKCKKKKKR